MNKNTNEKNFFHLILLGFIIGIASITPGLSGGVLAISFGIYTSAIDAVINLRREFKKSFLFLTPIAIGAVAGILIFGVIMKPLFENFETNVIYFFMGMIIGSLPSYLKDSNKKGFRVMYIVPMLIAFSLGIILSTTVISSSESRELTTVTSLISGGVLSLGMVIPGISSSFILIQMNVYEELISAILGLNISVIFWVVVGFALVSILTVKLVNFAFNKFHGYAHYAALGFLISSVVSVFPGFQSGIMQIINLLLFVIGAVVVFLFMKKTE